MMLNEKQKRLKELLEKNINSTERIGTAIAITGSWGVGKTYFWNKFLEEVTKKEIKDKKDFYYEASRVDYKSVFDCRKYAYISLFGIENLSDLKNAICTKLTLNPYAKIDSNKWEFSQLFKNTVSQFKDMKVSQYGVSASAKILESLLFLQVKDAIICFDDFERMSNKLDIKDVMGLANQLKLEKNCQVILILDESKTEDKNKEKYAEYKEKLIDETIKITSVEPLIRENAKDIDGKLVDLMVEFAEKLEIHNFRFFQKVIKLYKQFLEQLPEQVAYSTKEIILVRILQGYLIEDYGQSLNVGWNNFTTEKAMEILEQTNDDDLNKVTHNLFNKLNNIHYKFTGSSDGWFIQFKNWFEQKDQSNRDILYSLANSELISERFELLKERKKKLWNEFWNNQIGGDFPKKLYESTVPLISVENIENLDFTCTILNKLGAVELANELSDKIYQWIDKELKEDQLSFIDNFASWKRSKNNFYEYIDKYQEEHLYEGLPSLLETVHQYTINNGWSPKHIRSLEIASKNDWKELLFEKIPNDERFQYVNSNLIASKMIKQSMKPELNQDIKKMIIKIYEEKGQESEFYKNYMNYLIARLDD
ncbi:P-loop NTPase fold protein [Acinetobacter wuhouensis]|uniref:KAP family P-loop domain protein n=1 Tax=Acinetobacter wuhouensis TaxID=1879050 RepID=A0A4Q7AH57_9GAMM|nr:P-loop NTPase fold protein [Acinetobacter wuhouensis]RZG47202.1 KAP family P-loop domain protein [Acinetobacter wuhouensis]